MHSLAGVLAELGKPVPGSSSDRPAPLRTISVDSTLKDAIALLAEHRILSAPVVNKLKIFVGIVDIQMLLDTILKVKASSADWSTAEQTFATPVSEVCKSIKNDLSFISPEGVRTPVADGVNKYFVQRGHHRVAVTDCDAGVFSVLSQSDVIKYLARHPDAAPAAILSSTLETVGLHSRPVLSADQDLSAVDALLAMHDARVRVAPVIGKDGKLAGHITASHLRGLRPEDLKTLDQPLGDFLSALRKRARDGDPKLHVQEDKGIPTVTKDTTVQEVVQKVAANGVHEVFVLDGDAVRSVVTLTDLLKLLYGTPAK